MYDFFLITRWHLHLVEINMHHSSLFGFCCVWDKWNDDWYFMQLTLWMCPRRKWLQRSFQLRGQGKMPLEKVPVWPHKWMWSLTDIGSEVRNTSTILRQLKVGRSSRRGRSSWGNESMPNSRRKLPGGSGLNMRHPWLSMIHNSSWSSTPIHGPRRRESETSAPGCGANGSPLMRMPLIGSWGIRWSWRRAPTLWIQTEEEPGLGVRWGGHQSTTVCLLVAIYE